MITKKELNPRDLPMTPVVAKNFEILFQRMNELRGAYGKPMIVTSGLRSEEDQARLMAEGKTRAVHSKHMAGAAADIADPDGELARWAKENEDVLRRIGLWCEDPEYTKGWAHFQIMPPMSQKRFFKP